MNQVTLILQMPSHTHKILTIFLVALIMLCSPVKSNAGIDQWTSANLQGGVIQAVIIDPSNTNVVYAGTAGSGIFKTSDEGISWSAVNSGLSHLDVQTIAIDPNVTSILYAGTNGGGIFKTTDGGSNWIAINTGIGNLNIYEITVSSADSNVVYAASFGNLYKTADGGQGWTRIGLPNSRTDTTNVNAIINNAIYSVILNTTVTPETVYIGTHAGTVFEGLNGGQIWSRKDTGLSQPSSPPRNYSIRSIRQANAISSNFFVATQGDGVLFSADSGNTWNPVNNDLFCLISAPCLANPTPRYDSMRALAIDSVDTIYVGTENGFFQSSDSGATWLEAAIELDTMSIAVAADDTLYAGTTHGLYQSKDSGNTWTALNTGIINFNITDIAIHATNPSIQYATSTGSGVVKTIDGGATWAFMNIGITDINTLAIDIDESTDPETVYVGTTRQGMFKSTDGGAIWIKLNGLSDPFTPIVRLDPVTPTTVYGGSLAGLNVSTNSGTNWSFIMNGIIGQSDLTVDAFAIDPIVPTTLYLATTGSGVYKNIDDISMGTVNWLPSSTGLDNVFVYTMAIDPTNTSILFAGTRGGGVYISTDAAASWTAINNGLTDFSVNTLVINPVTPSIVYAGTEQSGVFKTTDSGANWFAINTGLTDTTTNTLELDSSTSPPTLYVGTSKDGIFAIQSTVASSPSVQNRSDSANTDGGNSSSGGGSLSWLILLLVGGYRQRYVSHWRRSV